MAVYDFIIISDDEGDARQAESTEAAGAATGCVNGKVDDDDDGIENKQKKQKKEEKGAAGPDDFWEALRQESLIQ